MNVGLLSMRLARKVTVSGRKVTGSAIPPFNTVTCVNPVAESAWKS
jgi:hypothetical protein